MIGQKQLDIILEQLENKILVLFRIREFSENSERKKCCMMQGLSTVASHIPHGITKPKPRICITLNAVSTIPQQQHCHSFSSPSSTLFPVQFSPSRRGSRRFCVTAATPSSGKCVTFQFALSCSLKSHLHYLY